ncbi:bifunctional metallophosphatase/5'-nucleotidase [Staphylococcus pseudoxylosus]|uniref:bifunctional metallophosphatase/5'-nucleotidase n=1 Tax=Staphylococcus pseudoxylosus TaxID=2282419 RepID=UPI000D1EBD19|nr:bifunctional UDP-sugar hydrolase/5'-nucleotidase [Staphylococcus pseudoxylosus]PTI81361.1 bifunctional metallophosphatase/5'-nucleotidase [Staphylococcus xylosus]MBM2658139.1 bifunctional metallophosphatase/5'-nucleotidase [Staphylococcus pseudoxylosus]MDW8546214.1 bifunctional UDP-sugar hydrolase/5'-nucleotidase [Staphylococcus pseudoxylosus]MEB5784126.1 bifunctional metallophosphatase/5'-nucleotidase [Staphylococcus pseudoxylosus]MEB6332357.1 bifunctional metallophosphatase/5'-nucleotidas
MKLTIYHTNDIHSHLHEYARITEYLTQKRPQLNHHSLYLDIGDHVDLSAPVTEATMGIKNVELLNEAHCDIATIGNNEGMTISHDALNTLYDNATFDVTCANVFDEQGRLPRNMSSSFIKVIDGVRILFIAATAPFTPFYRALDWIVTNPLEAIKDEINANEGAYDLLVIMSHVGVFFDEKLCQEIPEIDLILGSHTHHYFENGEINNGVLMAAAGKYGHFLGEVTLEIENNSIVKKQAILHPLDKLPEVETHFDEEGKMLLNDSVIDRPISLPRRTDTITQTAHILAESIFEFTNADCTIINAGLIVNGIEAERLTEYDIHQMLPHPINAVRIRLSGRELKNIIIKSQKQEYLNEHAQGLGFRGNIFGGYILYNLGFIESESRYFINGELINDDETYILGTIDMYTFGRYFPTLKDQSIDYLMPEFLRDIFKEKLLEY